MNFEAFISGADGHFQYFITISFKSCNTLFYCGTSDSTIYFNLFEIY